MSAFLDPSIGQNLGGVSGVINSSSSTPTGSTGGTIGSIIGSVGGSLLGPIGTGVGGVLGNLVGGLFGKKKVSAPPEPTGAQLGQKALDYYNAAFPGTSPWERLGTSNPAGEVASTSMSAQNTANISNEDRKQRYVQTSLDTFDRVLNVMLKKSQVDLQQQEVNIKNKQYGLDVQRTANDTYRAGLENRRVGFEGQRTNIDQTRLDLEKLLLPSKQFANYASPIAGLVGALGFSNLFKKQNNQNEWKLKYPDKSNNTYNMGYINPYTGKPVPD